MKIKKGYHCAYETHYHIVFPVKYRKALLQESIVQAIKEISRGIEERYEFELEQIGCDINHIHLLCSLHPKHSPGSFVRLYKSITAKQIFQRFPELRKDLWGGEFWSDGYYVATVGVRGDWSVVEKYIKQQGEDPQVVQLRMF
jgi:putative transposase